MNDVVETIRLLKEKADKYDATQQPDGEFVLVPRRSYEQLKVMAAPPDAGSGHAAIWAKWLDDLRRQDPKMADSVRFRVETFALNPACPPDWPLDRVLHFAFIRTVELLRLFAPDGRRLPPTPFDGAT